MGFRQCKKYWVHFTSNVLCVLLTICNIAKDKFVYMLTESFISSLKMKTSTIVVLLAVLLMSEQAVGQSWWDRFRNRVQSGFDTASGHVQQAAEEAEAIARQAAERARDAAARARELARQAADGTRDFVRRRIDDLD